jgi:protein kinase-like protein
VAEIWTVPGFTHVCELGAGDSGRVVQAVDDLTQTPVAIKYLDERLRRDERFQARFRVEARKLSQLEDPNLVQVFEYVEAPHASALVMELVHGVTLGRMLRTQGPTGPPAALVAFGGSLMALAAVHGAGIVHGGYEPANVLVDESGNCKLADVSIGIREGDDTADPAYLAPEQWAGGPPSPAGDIYAATAVFFECLTGRPPFQGKNPAALAKAHRTEPIPVEAVPEPLRGLVLAGLAKNPADRPASAEMFLGVLDDAAVATYGAAWETQGRNRLAELVAKTAATPLVTPSSPAAGEVSAGGDGRPRRRRRRLLGAVAIVAVLGAVGAAGVYGMGIADGSGDTTPPDQSTTAPPTPTSPPGGAVAGPPPSTPAALARAITAAAAARRTAAFSYRRDGGRGSATAARGVFAFAGEPASSYDMTVWSPVQGGRYTAKIRTVLVGGTAYVHGSEWNQVPATTRGGRTDATHTYAALAAEARWSTSVQHVLALLRSTPTVRRSGLTYAGSATLATLARDGSVAPLYAQFTRAPRGTRITYRLKVDRDFLPVGLQVRITPPKGGKARPQVLLVTYAGWGRKAAIAAPTRP